MNAESIPQRKGQEPRPGRSPNEREGGDVEFYRSRARPLADQNVDTCVPAGHSIQQIDELYKAVLAEPQPDDAQILETMRRVMIETETQVQLRGGIEAERTVWD